MVNLVSYLTISALLFALGLAGTVLNRKNVIILLMCIELLLLAVNINFIAFSHFFGNNSEGQIFVLLILTVAAAEAAIGLAILMVLYRNKHTIDVASFNTLKG